jgi:CDGSH-type Zn-finger protein
MKAKQNLEEYNKLQIIFEEIENQKDYIVDRKVIDKKLKPKVAMGGPYLRHLYEGKDYFYCTCGFSETQPYCDGKSHEGTGFQPLKFRRNIQSTLTPICGCKYNKVEAGAYCDGSHIDCDW